MTAYLHDLCCDGEDCHCAVLYPVTFEDEPAYNPMTGVSGESDSLSRGASPVLTPLAARHRVSGNGSKP